MIYKEDTIKGNRIYFLDNLRIFMIFLVVLIHAGGVYESTGFWGFFWIVDDPSTNKLPGILFLILDIFVMPTIFLISGFFTPLSLKNKSGWEFLKSKFKRLMIPWIIAVLTLMPLYKFIFLYSRNLPQESWTTYFHWSNGIWGQNWLWFLPVLFLFDILYLFFSRVKIELPQFSLKKAIGAIFLVGFIFSFCMDLLNGQGWTNTILIDFQNERLLIYFMIFLLGSLCYKRKAFESKLKSKNLYLIIVCTAWIPIILYRFLFIQSFMGPGNTLFSERVDTLLIWFNFHLSLLCLLYVMINTFRIYLNKQGRISQELNKNSFNVYIIHTIVLGGLALTMLNTAIPSLLKFFILTVSTYAASNLIITFYRKVIKSKIIIKRKEVAMKTVTTAMLVVALLTGAGCGNQENSAPSVGLHMAAIQGNLAAVNQHIVAGSNLNEKEPSRASSPLITAAVFGETEIALALIEAGADVNYKNNDGSTALITAAFFCRTEIVMILLENGADKNAINNDGRTALESVAGPFDAVKGFYDGIGAALKPLGLKLDYEQIKMTRPKIAELLRDGTSS